MSIGSMFVAAAATLIVAAYLVRPFRIVRVAKGADLDRDIDSWVSRVQSEGPLPRVQADVPAAGAAEAGSESVNFCFKCGRRLKSDDRFCPGCGTQIERGGAQ